MLAEKTGIYKEMIRLIFHGSPMVDNQTLADHKVVAGAVIHMILQMRGERRGAAWRGARRARVILRAHTRAREGPLTARATRAGG